MSAKLLHVTRKQLGKLIEEHSDEIINKARETITTEMVNKSTLALIKVLHDDLGYGKLRVERFIKSYNEVFEAFCEGYVEFDDLAELAKEIGVGTYERTS